MDPFEDHVTGRPSSPLVLAHCSRTRDLKSISLSLFLPLCLSVCPPGVHLDHDDEYEDYDYDHGGQNPTCTALKRWRTRHPGGATFGNGQQVSERHIIFHVPRGLIENLYGPKRQSLLRHIGTHQQREPWRCWCVVAAAAAAAAAAAGDGSADVAFARPPS